MSEIEEIKAMLQSHITDSNTFRTEMKESIAKIEVHGEYSKEKLEAHESTINDLKTAHNKQKGAMWVLGAMGLGGMAKAIVDVFTR